MKSLMQILIDRDGLTEQQAQEAIKDAHSELDERLSKGEMPFDLMEELFGLEPDYLEELL